MKLTHHIAIRYIGAAIVVLLVSIPLFYFVLQRVMWHSIDENMAFQREWMVEQLKSTSPENFISFNNNIIIHPGQFRENERIYNETIYIPYDKEMVPYRVLEFNIEIDDKPYAIRIQKSLVESEDVLQAIAAMQIGILLLLLTALAFINKNLRKKVWKPFYNTLDTLKKYRIDHDEPLNLSKVSITEINNLNKSLNELTKNNRKIYIAQKEFTENASHELQTPLALMQSNLDLLWQTSPINEEQSRLLQNLTEINSRMNKLNKSLLLLAKIDNRQFTDKKQIDINALVEKILSRHIETFNQKGIEIQKNITSTVTMFADETLVETLFINLISNALHYTQKNGTVTMKLSAAEFKIGNTATGQSLNTEKLFKRFQKQNQSASIGTGLGLEICKRICDLNAFTIRYEFADGTHWFLIHF